MAPAASLALPMGATIVIPGIVVLLLVLLVVIWVLV
jgi:hypothetical protein